MTVWWDYHQHLQSRPEQTLPDSVLAHAFCKREFEVLATDYTGLQKSIYLLLFYLWPRQTRSIAPSVL